MSIDPKQLQSLAASQPEVAALWLYGSQAKGNATEQSDWDLAVAFDPVKTDNVLDNRLRAELLAMDWVCRKESSQSSTLIWLLFH